MKDIDPENLVFIDETGVMLGLTRNNARFLRNSTQTNKGTRVYEMKPFYRGKKVTIIGAISMKEVVGLMTINNLMDSKAFKVFIEFFLLPELWPGAVVVMDNLPAHKLASIEHRIESVGAKVLNLSTYSPDFNQE